MNVRNYVVNGKSVARILRLPQPSGSRQAKVPARRYEHLGADSGPYKLQEIANLIRYAP